MIEIQGWLSEHTYGEAEDILFVSSVKEPLADYLENKITRKNVSVSYYVTDKQCSWEEAQTEFIKKLFGAVYCVFASHYSEITGYLWTDEWCKVGGHDIIDEFRSHVGSYLLLKIEVN